MCVSAVGSSTSTPYTNNIPQNMQTAAQALTKLFKEAGLSDDDIKKVLNVLLGKGAEASGSEGADEASGCDGGDGASGCDGADETSGCDASDGDKESIGNLLEKLLKALGLDDNTIQQVLTALNNGAGKAGSTGSSSGYYADSFAA